jgi:ABC-type phosphate transport system substrate-binding protein
LPALAQNEDVAVVVSEGNQVGKITLAELRKIFAGEKRSWPGSVPIKLIVRAPGAYERVVMLRLLGMSESEYAQYWTKQVFRGEAQAAPVALFSNGMQKEALASFPGAIVLMVPQDVKRGMKVLKVDGCLPGEAGYPVR